jgi:hypothetical protein
MSACNTVQLVLQVDQRGKAVELFDDMQWHRWTIYSKFSRRILIGHSEVDEWTGYEC